MIKDKDPGSRNYIARIERDLMSARNRMYDLERSLTQLLIHHGYLLHGTGMFASIIASPLDKTN